MSAKLPSKTTRLVAKLIDLGVIGVFFGALPYPGGILLGMAYALSHDGLFNGQSIGKKICKLRVELLSRGMPCKIRESALRNISIGVFTVFGLIPFWGWILMIVLGFPLLGYEVYTMWKESEQRRLGDLIAETRVVDLD